MKQYNYFYIYCECTSALATNSIGDPIWIGWGRVKIFECIANDILEADKLFELACKMKVNWSKQPFTRVVCNFDTIAVNS